MATTATRRTLEATAEEFDEVVLPDSLGEPLKLAAPAPESEPESDLDSEDNLASFAASMAAIQKKKPEKLEKKKVTLTEEDRAKKAATEADAIKLREASRFGTTFVGYIVDLGEAKPINPFGLFSLFPVYSFMKTYVVPATMRTQKQRHVVLLCTEQAFKSVRKCLFPKEDDKNSYKNYLNKIRDEEKQKTIGTDDINGVTYYWNAQANAIGVCFNITHLNSPKLGQRLEIVKELIDLVDGIIPRRVIVKTPETKIMSQFMNENFNGLDYMFEAAVSTDKKQRDARCVIQLDPTLGYEDLRRLTKKIENKCEDNGFETHNPLLDIFRLQPKSYELMLQLPPENMPSYEKPIEFKDLDTLGVPSHVERMLLFKTPSQPFHLTLAVMFNQDCNPVPFVQEGRGCRFEGKDRNGKTQLVPEENCKTPMQIVQNKRVFSFSCSRNVRVIDMIAEVNYLTRYLADYLIY